MEVERVNPRTGQKEKIIQKVYNMRIKNDQMDKYKLAASCKNWRLNEALCRQVKSDYHREQIFVWAKAEGE